MRVPDSGVFAMGLAVFPSYHLLQATDAMITTPPPPHGGVEVRMNPQQGIATIRSHHPAPFLCVPILAGAPVSSFELCSGRPSVLAGVCDSGIELANTHLVPDIQTSLPLSWPTSSAAK